MEYKAKPTIPKMDKKKLKRYWHNVAKGKIIHKDGMAHPVFPKELKPRKTEKLLKKDESQRENDSAKNTHKRKKQLNKKGGI